MTAPTPAQQLPLDLGHQAAHGRDDLVEAPSNAAAIALVDRWPDWPATLVVLAGPPGSGKSHLAAIWRERSGAVQIDRTALSAQTGDQSTGRDLLIEDIDLAPVDEQGLFHLINAARAAGAHLLITARRFPLSWGVALPDLVSRLKAATTVEIGEPDDILLAAVITKLFSDRQIEVEPHVVHYLVRRIERSLAAAIQVVDRLDRAAMERKMRITRTLAADVLARDERAGGQLRF